MIRSRQVQLVFVMLFSSLLVTGFMYGSTYDTDRGAVEERNHIFMETYRNMDASGMAELYTTDGKLLPPNSETVEGREDLTAYWKAVMDMGISEVLLHTGKVERHGNALVEVSNAELRGEDGAMLDMAKYIVIWKLEGGTWKMYLDIFNSNLPVE